ncbi:MAG: helix-turn-helix transcriptional regulator [Myxococcales bacterium]|nr:helix-turn-helix transcriptional regulator [Myxococcales bacterium]
MRSRAIDPDEAVRAFGRRVAEVRHDRGWTPEQLAERAEVSVRYVQHIEQGTQNLSIRSAVKLAGVLRCRSGCSSKRPGGRKQPSKRGRPRAQQLRRRLRRRLGAGPRLPHRTRGK